MQKSRGKGLRSYVNSVSFIESDQPRSHDMTDSVLTVEYQDKVAVLTMTYRPYNLTSPTLSRALLAAFEEAVRAGSRAVLIKSGLKHFSAGADLNLFDERIA